MLQKLFVFLILSFFPVALWADDEEAGQFVPGAKKEGFYAAIGTGKFFFTDKDRSEFADGWLIGFKLGYDFVKYAGVEIIFRTSGHESNVKTVTVGTNPSFFGYQFGGLAKGAYPITRRLFVGGGLGGGIWYTKPNQKPTRGEASRGMFMGEMNIEYYLRTRGLSIGLDPSVSGITDLKSAVFQLTGFIRHTF